MPDFRERVHSALLENELAIRTAGALARANFRYWRGIAPQVRRELRRWSRHAKAIPDPHLRAIALGKLRSEHFNAEVAATLATTVPARHRTNAIEAIVAFEVLYDYLDGLTEHPASDPLRDGARAYRAFTAIFDGERSTAEADDVALEAYVDDGGYVRTLSAAVRDAVATLPSSSAVARTGRRAAERCAAGQIRVHAASRLGDGQLEQWARASVPTRASADWREYLAGAVASVLAVHALIAASADRAVTEEQAEAIDAAYLSVSALSTMLDSLIDYERDARSGDAWLVRLYGDPLALGEELRTVAARAVNQVRALPNRAHHLMTLLGVVSYYTSAPQARRGPARLSVLELHRELRPVILPTLTVMHAWRLAKWVRRTLVGRSVR
jgi:tetraprenyl-beta-curcumene synthase